MVYIYTVGEYSVHSKHYAHSFYKYMYMYTLVNIEHVWLVLHVCIRYTIILYTSVLYVHII